MKTKPSTLRLTLPWCEADSSAYADAIEEALDERGVSLSDVIPSHRVEISLSVFPAHYSSCTLQDVSEEFSEALNLNKDVVRIDARISRPTDKPRIVVAITGC